MTTPAESPPTSFSFILNHPNLYMCFVWNPHPVWRNSNKWILSLRRLRATLIFKQGIPGYWIRTYRYRCLRRDSRSVHPRKSWSGFQTTLYWSFLRTTVSVLLRLRKTPLEPPRKRTQPPWKNIASPFCCLSFEFFEEREREREGEREFRVPWVRRRWSFIALI